MIKMRVDTGKTEYTKEDFLKEVLQAFGPPFKVITCLNCGAFALHTHNPNLIEHYKRCQPGEAEYWGRYYEEAAKEEDNEL